MPEDVTELFHRYVDARQSVWNHHFFPYADNIFDEGDKFRKVDRVLLASIVFNGDEHRVHEGYGEDDAPILGFIATPKFDIPNLNVSWIERAVGNPLTGLSVVDLMKGEIFEFVCVFEWSSTDRKRSYQVRLRRRELKAPRRHLIVDLDFFDFLLE
ncbi:MAG: hypothetical protein AAGC81_18095 [Pseudomonadota bacterium]